MKFPDNECVGVGESHFRLLQASGHEKDKDDIAIPPKEYVNETAIFGIDFEKAGNEALFSGISTRGGKVEPAPRTVLLHHGGSGCPRRSD